MDFDQTIAFGDYFSNPHRQHAGQLESANQSVRAFAGNTKQQSTSSLWIIKQCFNLWLEFAGVADCALSEFAICIQSTRDITGSNRLQRSWNGGHLSRSDS